jgi:hypothetical protein
MVASIMNITMNLRMEKHGQPEPGGGVILIAGRCDGR